MKQLFLVSLIVVLSLSAVGQVAAAGNKPDVRIPAASVTVPDPARPSTVKVEITVGNPSDVAAGAFTVRWYPHHASGVIGCSKDIPQLAAHGRGTFRCNYTYPAGERGTMHWKAVADSDNDIAESNENNNTETGTVVIQAPSPPAAKADLAFTAATIDQNQVPVIYWFFTVTNKGGTASGSYRLELTADTGQQVAVHVDVPSLGPGQEQKHQLNHRYMTSGEKNWRIVVDGPGRVPESNEDNNAIWGSVTIPASAVPASPAPGPGQGVRYGTAFGIDYAHPNRYLAQGEQSHISDPSVVDELRVEQQSLGNLGDIYRWLKSDFTTYSAGGETIGVVTVDELLQSRRLGGCHDHGLVYAAVARELGYPAVMARTVSIEWIEGFQAGETGPHIGHVFVEVYLDGRWVLVDSTNGWYVVDGYNPVDPVIPLKKPVAEPTAEHYGFYVERKGIDTWSFGIHSPQESNQTMEDLGRRLDLDTIVYPEYDFGRFARQ